MKISQLGVKAFIIALFIINIAYASPVINSDEDQSFDKNQISTQLRNITISESEYDPMIIAGEIRITLPSNVEIIFDDERSEEEILLYGTAVDNGRLEEKPQIEWEDKDKTLVIPILQDFEEGEWFVITKLYVEGFNEASTSSGSITLNVSGSNEIYTDSKYLYVKSSSLNDTNKPEMPSNIVLNSTDEGVQITWEDPTDLDVSQIHILRGVNEFPVGGTYYELVAPGVEMFIDEDLNEGDVVSYILRASDGRNYSDNSEEMSITYIKPANEEAEDVDEEEPSTGIEEEDLGAEDVDEEEPSIDLEEDISIEEEDTEEIGIIEPAPYFSDMDGHWAKLAVESMASLDVIFGDPDGTFRPDDALNRAEAGSLIARLLYYFFDMQESTYLPFSDVSGDTWYFQDLGSLYFYNIVSGNPDGTFEPAEDINRAEFLTMALNLYIKVFGEPLDESSNEINFADIDEDDWFFPYVDLAAQAGWVSGYDCDLGTCFKADQVITRAEAAQMLYNMFYGILGGEEF